MPNCASWSSPSAISAHLPPKRKIQNKDHVQVFCNFASSLLCLGEASGSARSRPRADELGTGSIREISSDLRISEDCLVAQAAGHLYEPQGGFAPHEQTEYSFGDSQAKDLPKHGQV